MNFTSNTTNCFPSSFLSVLIKKKFFFCSEKKNKTFQLKNSIIFFLCRNTKKRITEQLVQLSSIHFVVYPHNDQKGKKKKFFFQRTYNSFLFLFFLA